MITSTRENNRDTLHALINIYKLRHKALKRTYGLLEGAVDEIVKPVLSGIGISLSSPSSASRVDEIDECWGFGADSSLRLADANVSRSTGSDMLDEQKESDQPMKTYSRELIS